MTCGLFVRLGRPFLGPLFRHELLLLRAMVLARNKVRFQKGEPLYVDDD